MPLPAWLLRSWPEAMVPLEMASLLCAESFWNSGLSGDGHPVMVIPGFAAAHLSLWVLARWLERGDHVPYGTGLWPNTDCGARAVAQLTRRAEAIAGRHGERVLIIAQSRGGVQARVLAVERPDLVSMIITLGSPLRNPVAVTSLPVRLFVDTLVAAGTAGMPRLLSQRCLDGVCCGEMLERLAGPFPHEVGFVSIYSRRDGVIDWRTCLDPAADHVEISSSHCGMAYSPQAYRAIASALRSVRPERSATTAGPHLRRTTTA
jgi:pimeloyl-ACP methyl ester carboxylesterase